MRAQGCEFDEKMDISFFIQSRYWEANLKDRKPSESNIDGWIRAKYEHKRWAMKGPVPDPSTLGSETVSVSGVLDLWCRGCRYVL